MKNITFMLSEYNTTIQNFLEKQGAKVISNSKRDDFNAVIFTPGEDISPFLYGQTKLKRTNVNIIRDMNESRLYRNLKNDVLKIGIGRGAQMLCIQNGGSLYQYTDGHLDDHSALDLVSGTEVYINSKHKQQMILPDSAEIILAASISTRKETPTKTSFIDPNSNKSNYYFSDPEVAFCRTTKSFMFQPRITYGSSRKADKNTNDLFISYFNSWLKEHIDKTFNLNNFQDVI